ncbi:Peroxisomal Acyl-Coenzyme A Oxidase 2 [Manis pentadactyla]|nr:Peroxisomal Acyl-Coenzyme A Oxidase 2 [Manis pentadactyla]
MDNLHTQMLHCAYVTLKAFTSSLIHLWRKPAYIINSTSGLLCTFSLSVKKHSVNGGLKCSDEVVTDEGTEAKTLQ